MFSGLFHSNQDFLFNIIRVASFYLSKSFFSSETILSINFGPDSILRSPKRRFCELGVALLERLIAAVLLVTIQPDGSKSQSILPAFGRNSPTICVWEILLQADPACVNVLKSEC